LTPTESDEADVPWVYADLQTALKGLMSAEPAVKAIQTSGEDRAIAGVLAEGYAIHLPQEDQ